MLDTDDHSLLTQSIQLQKKKSFLSVRSSHFSWPKKHTKCFLWPEKWFNDDCQFRCCLRKRKTRKIILFFVQTNDVVSHWTVSAASKRIEIEQLAWRWTSAQRNYKTVTKCWRLRKLNKCAKRKVKKYSSQTNQTNAACNTTISPLFATRKWLNSFSFFRKTEYDGNNECASINRSCCIYDCCRSHFRRRNRTIKTNLMLLSPSLSGSPDLWIYVECEQQINRT